MSSICYNISAKSYVSKTYHNCIDYVFLNDPEQKNINKITNSLYLLRVTNVQTEFMTIKFPGISLDVFKRKVKEIVDEHGCEVKFVKMKDSQMFAFEYEFDYAVISSTNIWSLKNCHNDLNSLAHVEYSKIQKLDGKYVRVNVYGEISELDAFDLLMYKYTESPFRYTLNSLTLTNIPYLVSTKYDIPIIGPIEYDLNKFEEFDIDDPINLEQKSSVKNRFFTKCYTVDFSKLVGNFNIENRLYKMTNDSSSLNSLKVIAYDIETYNPDENPDSTKNHQPIICIGFSIFNVNDPKPIRRFSFITKEFAAEDISKYKSNKDVINTKTSTHKYFLYDYLPETNFDNVRTDFGATDDTIYMICGKPSPKKEDYIDDELGYINAKRRVDFQNERDILGHFIQYIADVKPFVVTGFNNWKFDDVWIFNKSKIHKLDKQLLNALSYYETTTAKFGTIKPKLDGEVVKDDQYKTFTEGFTLFHDVMFSAKKEDPKKFSQRNRANLDTMLSVFNIVSPYNGKTLSKTDMKIAYMFKCWKNNEHIYLIAKYCCQDAWITGCLAISRNMFGDLIEMSNMTYTSFNDSLHKAVGVRVTNTIQWYAHHSNIAYYDSPDNESRKYQLHSAVGQKYFDKRTLIGGAVKNKRNGREFFIQALDFSSMYPSQKEGSNTDTSSRVDIDMIRNPEKYNLRIVDKYFLEDVYTARWFYEFEDLTSKNRFKVEQFFCEYKIDPKLVKELNSKFHEIRLNQFISSKIAQGIENDLLRRMMNLIQGEDETYLNRKHFGNPVDEYGHSVKEFLQEKAKYLLLADYVKDVPSIRESYSTEEQLLVEKFKDFKIPARVLFPIYFVQSPKDPKTNLPVIHYSLKEKMLSDLRAKRSIVKKTKARNLTEEKQLNAKQLAIKVVMNSEYGQTGSDLFAHYDSDVGAAVTFASRKCIAELTSCLLSEHFYVNESYKDNKHLKYLQEVCKRFGDDSVKFEYIEYQPSIDLALEGSQRSKEDLERIRSECFDQHGNFIKSIDIFSEIDFRLPPRRLTSDKVYNQLRNQLKEDIHSKIYVWRITLPKSELVYQDTDSNYYTNEYLISLWDVLNPDTINEIMQTLFEHDSLLGDLISEIINRRPIGVGWEGAFVVARYLNKKKKYYGKKWTIPAEGGLMKSTITIKRDKSYQRNDYEKEHSKETETGFEIEYNWKNLPDDYEMHLSTKSKNKYVTYNCLIPYKDGSFFKVKDFQNQGIDPLDFVNSHGIKCTGVDLARRDQYKFININNMLIYQNDLKYCDSVLEVKNPIKYKVEKVKLTTVVDKLMNDFRNVQFSDYELEDYTRTKSFHSDRRTEVPTIVNKLRTEISKAPTLEYKIALEGNVPIEGERTSYVMISKENPYSLIVQSDKVVDKGYILGHLLNRPLEFDSHGKRQYRLIGQNEFNSIKEKSLRVKLFLKENGIYIPAPNGQQFEEGKIFAIHYNKMTREMIFDSLDFKYYFECLAEVLCNYIVIEANPSIADYINGNYAEEHPELSDKEIEKIMAKEIDNTKIKLAKSFVQVAFPEKVTERKKAVKKTSSTIQYTCPNLNELNDLEKKLSDQLFYEANDWQYMTGQPDLIIPELDERIMIVSQKMKSLEKELAEDLLSKYKQLRTFIIKKYNVDKSTSTIIVTKFGETQKEQKYKIYFNPNDSLIKRIKKNQDEHTILVKKEYPAEMFGNINDVNHWLIDQIILHGYKVEFNQGTESEQVFKSPKINAGWINEFIPRIFKIADLFLE